MTQIDAKKIQELAEKYQPAMTAFLRDMIRLPSESGSSVRPGWAVAK